MLGGDPENLHPGLDAKELMAVLEALHGEFIVVGLMGHHIEALGYSLPPPLPLQHAEALPFAARDHL